MIKGEEAKVNSHRPALAPARPLAYQVLRDGRAREEMSALWYRRRRQWRCLADRRCAGRQRRCRDKFAIALPRRRTIGICGGVTRHATTGEGITVRVRCRETVRECFQKRDDLVFLPIRQAEHTRRRVEVVRDLFHRPTGHSLDCSCRAVSGGDRVGKFGVARVVEMYELFQALYVAVVKERLLEIRPVAGLGSPTLRRCRRHIANCGHLELAVNHWCKLCPVPVWIGAGAETTSQEGSHSQISVAKAVRISDEPELVRSGLVIESVPRIERQPFIGRTKAAKYRWIRGGIVTGVDLAWRQSRSSSVDMT